MKKEYEARARYDAANTKQYRLKLNLKTDRDIIDRLAEVENKQGLIKDLIRQDMKLTPFVKALARKSAEGYKISSVVLEDNCLIANMGKYVSSITIKEDPVGNATVEEDGKILEVYHK